ncbi:hypothetical protein T05_8486 [Trichinella murrelli]|uniref:Uncharacterized protein n=1 Tax=Trichinella murrelli TaxID=144512 RepID=A0A0V0TRF9_9BILA|nr:hypothetical protein T05_8486 [Trichinella murrelli]
MHEQKHRCTFSETVNKVNIMKDNTVMKNTIGILLHLGILPRCGIGVLRLDCINTALLGIVGTDQFTGCIASELRPVNTGDSSFCVLLTRACCVWIFLWAAVFSLE